LALVSSISRCPALIILTEIADNPIGLTWRLFHSGFNRATSARATEFKEATPDVAVCHSTPRHG
jgi:hypothetical protein